MMSLKLKYFCLSELLFPFANELFDKFFNCRISGRILQLETVTQSEAMRRRYRYLSHFSLTTTFQVRFYLHLFSFKYSCGLLIISNC
jgi:hypothetical protein